MGLLLRNQVCVITFYAGQVACINTAIKSSNTIKNDGLRVMTVDSFQGSECDVVILSFVRNNSRGSVGFVKDYQRLNVALTRARHLLICVGCAATLLAGKSNNSTEQNHLSNIIIDAKSRGRFFVESELSFV